MTSTWSPNPTELETLTHIIAGASGSDSSLHAQMLKQLEQYSLMPEYNNYLSFIFALSHSHPINLKLVAGISLKNNLKSQWTNLEPSHPGVLEYCKACIIQALSDPQPMIRKTAGSIITTCVAGQIDRWPQVLSKLIELLDGEDTIAGAFGALEKICEDSAMELDDKDPNFVSLFLNKILSFIENPSAEIRASVLKCTNQFLIVKSNSIWNHFEAYMSILYKCTNDPSSVVKRYVCQAFNSIVELNPDVLISVLDSVISFMLHVMQEEDQESALEAADFFLIFCEQETMQIHVQQYLPKIVPILLKCMIFSQDEIDLLEASAENDAHVADNSQDIQPRFHKGKVHELSGEKNGDNTQQRDHIDRDESDDEEDEEEDDDYDSEAEWNLRKCSAASLDLISTVFGDDLLPNLLPTVNQMLSNETWQIKEAGILAIGAIAQGCGTGMEPHLPQLVPHFISLLNHHKPFVKSITCWTLGRYISWIYNPPFVIRNDPQAYQNHLNVYFIPLLQAILFLCLDKNKEVQKSACSTLAIIEEDAGEGLIPFLPNIISTISKALNFYQKKNLLVLYDAFSTLAENVGGSLNRPEYILQFMPPLLNRWHSIPDDDYDLFPLLECLSSVSVAVGSGFLPYAEPVWIRCISLIKNTIVQTQNFEAADTTLMLPDKDFMIVALDLLSGLIQGLGELSIPLITHHSNPSLFELLKYTMRDETPDVRSSSFALLGDLSINCYPTIVPHLNDIMTAIIINLAYPMESLVISAMNNAAWSAGEIALKHLSNMEPFINPLISKLILILNDPHSPRSLKENSAITMGRLGLACPQSLAPYLGRFIQKWCESLNLVHDNTEKATAFQGICAIIKLNPQALVPSFGYFCDAVLKWNVANLPELKQLFLGVFIMFRDALGEQWQTTLAGYPVHIQTKLREVYGI